MRRRLAACALAVAATATSNAQTRLERGAYLMKSIAACGNCHTPQGPNGPLPGRELAGGNVFAGNQWYGLTRWNGTAWTPIAGSKQGIYTLVVLPNGDVLAGGLMDYTQTSGPVTYERLVRWNGAQLTPIATPFAASRSSSAAWAISVALRSESRTS